MRLGDDLRVTLFGESHGTCVGALVEGIPPGTKIDLEALSDDLKLRKKVKIEVSGGITEKNIKSLKSADGLVVGSLLCKTISKSLEKRQNPVTNTIKIVKNLKRKIT